MMVAEPSPSPLCGGGSTRAQRERGEGVRAPASPPLPGDAARRLSLSREGERGLLETLAPLHVSALRLDPDIVRTLERLGLKTIGALLAMPRLALARRFRGADSRWSTPAGRVG